MYYVCTRYVCTMHICLYYVCIMYVCMYVLCMCASMLMVLASSRGTTGRRENHASQCVSVTPTGTERFNQLVL